VNVSLSIVAFFATFFPMLLVGIGLGVWAARRPKKPKWETADWYVDPLAQTANVNDTHATLDGSRDVRIKDLLDQCKKEI
jgi:hypothetical protein